MLQPHRSWSGRMSTVLYSLPPSRMTSQQTPLWSNRDGIELYTPVKLNDPIVPASQWHLNHSVSSLWTIKCFISDVLFNVFINSFLRTDQTVSSVAWCFHSFCSFHQRNITRGDPLAANCDLFCEVQFGLWIQLDSRKWRTSFKHREVGTNRGFSRRRI